MPATPHAPLRGEKILVTGATGQVAKPIATSLARDNEVWAVARFKDAAAHAALEQAGVRCVPHNLVTDSVDDLPADFDYVLNLAVLKSGHWDRDLSGNAEATGFLMHHCRQAKAVLHCSSTAVYAPNDHHPMAETDPLGDNHRTLFPTYSISKIAAETMAKYAARQWGIPTTIARLSVPYGDNGGWPAWHLEFMLAGSPISVHSNAPSQYNPLHEDDIIEQVPALLGVASVPATVVNWAGADVVSIEEWCAYLGELTGLSPAFDRSDQALESVIADTTRMRSLIGEPKVHWRDGFRRMVAARHPELLRA
jgi:UDP-glucuronate 4-epimerase